MNKTVRERQQTAFFADKARSTERTKQKKHEYYMANKEKMEIIMKDIEQKIKDIMSYKKTLGEFSCDFYFDDLRGEFVGKVTFAEGKGGGITYERESSLSVVVDVILLKLECVSKIRELRRVNKESQSIPIREQKGIRNSHPFPGNKRERRNCRDKWRVVDVNNGDEFTFDTMLEMHDNLGLPYGGQISKAAREGRVFKKRWKISRIS